MKLAAIVLTMLLAACSNHTAPLLPSTATPITASVVHNDTMSQSIQLYNGWATFIHPRVPPANNCEWTADKPVPSIPPAAGITVNLTHNPCKIHENWKVVFSTHLYDPVHKCKLVAEYVDKSISFRIKNSPGTFCHFMAYPGHPLTFFYQYR